MEPDPKSYNLPPDGDTGKEPPKEVIEPAVLVLAGQSVVTQDAASTLLYQLSRDVTSISRKGSSVIFERVERDVPEGLKDTLHTKPHNRHLFYLAHPADAQYRSDIPAYYITSVSPGMIGNICFETSKSRFRKTEFTALLSAKRSASDKPLFDEKAQKPLFYVKSKWHGGHYTWTDCDDRQIALEDGKGDQHKLAVIVSVEREIRDALVALWVLRLWRDTAESRQAKREALESLTPPVAYQSYSKLSKRAGALGGVGGGGA